jgi:hypothetical protein
MIENRIVKKKFFPPKYAFSAITKGQLCSKTIKKKKYIMPFSDV